jgi:hypothetical protein
MADLVKTVAVRDSGVVHSMAAAASTQTIPYAKDEITAILVTNASAASITATINKGTGIRSPLGNLVVTVAAGATEIIGPLDSMRFGAGGKYTLAISLITSITVGVIQLP